MYAHELFVLPKSN